MPDQKYHYNPAGYEAKPPLGLLPIHIYNENILKQRMNLILDAMDRYSSCNFVVPLEWIIELRELLGEYERILKES